MEPPKPPNTEPFTGSTTGCSEIAKQTDSLDLSVKKKKPANKETQESEFGGSEGVLDHTHPLKSRLKRKASAELEGQWHRIALREVLGNVQRRDAAVSRAQPPPSRQPQHVSFNQGRQTNERGRFRRQPMKNQDSDSDSDAEAGHQIGNDDSASSSNQRLLRLLKSVAEKCDSVRHIRASHRRHGDKRREQLFRQYRKERHDALSQFVVLTSIDARQEAQEALRRFHDYDDATLSDRLRNQIKEWDSKRQEYLDNALYSTLDQKLRILGQKENSDETLEEIILCVESDLVHSFEEFDRPWRAWGLQPSEREEADPLIHEMPFHRHKLNENVGSHERLACILAEMYLDWWIEFAYVGSGPQTVLQDVVTARLNSLYQAKRRPGELSTLKDLFTVPYIKRLGVGISYVLEVALVTELHPESLVHYFPDHIEVIDCIETSRINGSLSYQYMDWINPSLGAQEIEDICEKWKVAVRAETCKTYRRRMSSFIDIEQEFYDGIHQRSVVSLVLLKGGYPASIKDVSANELQVMGWFKDGKGGYWRYEYEAAKDDASFGEGQRPAGWHSFVLLWTGKFWVWICQMASGSAGMTLKIRKTGDSEVMGR
ncbi:hypothetical protein SGCOL_001133 [Colletotrichum sp. CLE4]